MSETLYTRAKRLFLEASAKPTDERAAFLDRSCEGDDRLRREVDSLLEHLKENDLDQAQGERIGNYLLVRPIGEGGMGVVWEARQERPLRRRVALKVLREELVGAEILARFEAERQTLALMEHPNIATVFDAGTDRGGRPFFAMEYVDGSPITRYCARHQLDLRARLRLMIAVCRGVEHAHKRGVIHRDLKPSNILVSEVDGKPIPKVIDFGVAKAISGAPSARRTLASLPGRFIGTPEYMSPEQAEADATLDARTDVYSLGVVLYELLAGSHPRAAPGSADTSEALRPRSDTPPIVPSSRAPSRDSEELRGALDRIALTALAERREQRYSSPAELADDLERFLAGEPVSINPASPALGPRRHRLSALAVALLAIAAIAAAVWMFSSGNGRELAGPQAVETHAELPSIAVLPFENLSGEPEDDYFGDGLAEELLNALAQIDGLRVAARVSSFSFKNRAVDARQIGEQLGVSSLLEGSVRRSEDRIRITAQLIDATTGLHLWSQAYDRSSSDLFQVQDEIAHAVSEALEIALVAPERRRGDDRTTDAYDLYLRGREYLRDGGPERLAAAIERFEAAIEADPSFAAAHSGRAEALILLARRGDLPMELADAEAGAALRRAIDLEPELAETHAVLGLLRIQIGDLDGAEVALRRAIELNSNLAIAHLRLAVLLGARGADAEATTAYRRAIELDPLNRDVNLSTARNLMNSGRYQEGLLQFRHWLRVEPESAETYRLMSMFARTYGKLDDAVVWALRAVELDPEAPLNVHEAEMAYSNLGEFDRAAEWMDRAYRLAPNNHWTFTLRAFQLIESGQFEALDRFLQGELQLHPPPEVDPLPQIDRVRLALAARSKVYLGDHERAVELSERALGTPITSILEVGFDADVLAFLAHSYEQLGRSEDAAAVTAKCLALLENQPSSFFLNRLVLSDTLAAVHVLQGEDDQAVAILETAVDDGWGLLSVLHYSPLFERLRARDDYRRLVRRVEERIAEMRARVRSTGQPEPQVTPKVD